MPATACCANGRSARSPSRNSTPARCVEVAALAGDEVVGDADGVAAANELFRQVRTDEAGAAGHEIRSHSVEAPLPASW